MQSLLPLVLASNSLGNVAITEILDNDLEETVEEDFFDPDDFPVVITDQDILEAESYIPILTYLAGYCIYSTLKKNRASFARKSVLLTRNFVHLINLI